MKTNVNRHKLKIDRETLVTLDARVLGAVNGGAGTQDRYSAIMTCPQVCTATAGCP